VVSQLALAPDDVLFRHQGESFFIEHDESGQIFWLDGSDVNGALLTLEIEWTHKFMRVSVFAEWVS
jgi:hypothetical protein